MAYDRDNVPDDAKMVRVTMGIAVDYFRPKEGVTIESMLTSHNQHLFSYDGIWWTEPSYYHRYYMGSKDNWPTCCGIASDDRLKLPIVGNRGLGYCGCCANDYEWVHHGWELSFKMEYLK